MNVLHRLFLFQVIFPGYVFPRSKKDFSLMEDITLTCLACGGPAEIRGK